MAFHDLKRYLTYLANRGELTEITARVDSDLQAPAIAARAAEEGAQVALFSDVAGSPKGYALVSGLYAGPGLLYPQARKPWTRLAMALDIGDNVDWEELTATLLTRRQSPINPIIVRSGGCEEEVHQGDAVDLLRFPFPRIHERDGGRYSNAHAVVVKDPDTGARLWGLHRAMVVSAETLVCHLPPSSPIGAVYSKYEARHEPMPICLVVGGNPAIAAAMGLGFAGKEDAAAVAGGLCLDPIELVQAETCDIAVPADAEIVIEGEVQADERQLEGPFVTFNGIEAASEQPVIKVKAITHSAKPILPFFPEGARFSDTMVLTSIGHSTELTNFCRLAGVPVRWVMCPMEARMGLCMVATRVPFNGYLWQLAKYLFSWSNWFDKILFLDHFVNPDEHIQAYNDMVNKANPTKSWRRTDLDAPVPLAAKYPTPEGVTARMQINATWDPKWPKDWLSLKISFEDNYPKEIQEQVLARWSEFGFGLEPVVVSRPSE